MQPIHTINREMPLVRIATKVERQIYYYTLLLYNCTILLVRSCEKYFNIPHLNMTFTSNILQLNNHDFYKLTTTIKVVT